MKQEFNYLFLQHKYFLMKSTKHLLVTFVLLVVVASLYRIMPGRPYGFAPQLAMAIFGGAVIKDKRFAFLLPLLSMFVSDALYEILYRSGIGNMTGFYSGQVTNYLLITAMTVFGFMIAKFNFLRILSAAVAAPTAYFLLSNFLVWISNGGYHRPKTFSGLFECYNDGLPFYPWSVASTLIFSALFFGSYYLATKNSLAVGRSLV